MGGSSRLVGHEPTLRVSRQEIRRIVGLLVSSIRFGGGVFVNTQRLSPELISGPCLDTKTRCLSYKRTHSTVLTGLLTGHNTLGRPLYLIGLSDSPFCRRCKAEDQPSAHILCEGEALASLRRAYLDYFFLEPEDIKNISQGVIWKFDKVTGLP
jgi:hypothetical protein